MMDPTVAEIQHWQGRIARRIDRQVEALVASAPGLLERIRHQARQRALQSLGLAELHADWENIAAQQQELTRRRRQALRALLATLRRVPLAEVADDTAGSAYDEVRQALQRRQAAHARDLLAEDQIGREVVRLWQEQEHLLDAVGLARAPRQIKVLWSKVLELLGQEPTALERAVLALGTNDSA
jgi:hypothetical protein